LSSFRRHLADHGLKFTGERRAIATALFESDSHLEAEELLARLRRSGSRVSRATVYRTLDLLVGAGLARKVRLGADHNFFEHILGRRQHEHMVCIGCGQVIEWFDPQLARLVERNTKEQGFAAARYTVQVFGRCADCQEPGS
jgi:Fur family ferric uptake transcriptional regulator